MNIPDIRALTARSPRLGKALLGLSAFVLASLFATLIAWGAAVVIEGRSARAVAERFEREGFAWAGVEADGLQLRLTGTAPNEAARFRAVNLAGSIVESSRVVDDFEVTPARPYEAPRFSVEMLRNDDGIQLIGLLPAGEDEARLTTLAEALMPDTPPSEMIETASYPAPEHWAAAFDYGMAALKMLPRSKISVDAEKVSITAIAASDQEKRMFEAQLNRARPKGVSVEISISAPRPVLTPFTLRFVRDAEGPRFDACSADSDQAKARILAAGRAAGVSGDVACTVGLGVPTPSWAAAAEAGIRAVTDLGTATITFSDADVSLMAGEDVAQATFDRVTGELQTALPPVFSLDATLQKKAVASPAGPAEFTAALTAETGKVELRGRVTDPMERNAVDNFARARFGADKVYIATRFDPELPGGWAVRVLAGLEALNELEEGSVLVRADLVEVKGVTGSQAARGRISQILSGQLGQGQTFRVNVRYDEALDPTAALPTPEECHDMIGAVLSRQKIIFTPGSAEIDAKAGPVMTQLAEILRRCEGVRMEIAGYTDAQGSEEGNRALSQARAEAVLLALQGRRVDIAPLRAVGYGEENPVADNGTEAGREANRRIEFSLVERPSAADAAADATGVSDDVVPASGGVPEAGAAPAAVLCRDQIAAILADRKIAFPPGSSAPTAETNAVLDGIAARLAACPGTAFEIGGFTDSQGSERGNQLLSQERANAVLVALAKRDVNVSTIKAMGYGETRPVADNGSEEGREANRRIEFRLLGRFADEAAAWDATQAAPAPATGDAATGPEPIALPEDGDEDGVPLDGTDADMDVGDADGQPEGAAPEAQAPAEAAAPGDATPPPATPPSDGAGGAANPAPEATGTAAGTLPAAGVPPAGDTAAPSPEPASTPASADTGPDFSNDDSPSLAPQEKTVRPPPRPAGNG